MRIGQGLPRERLGQVPPPGVHPRILISPDQLPDLRRRLKETEVGRTLCATMASRIQSALHDPQNWGSQFYEKLAAGDVAGATALIKEHGDLPKGIGHYKPWLYAVVLEALDAMITDDEARGKRVATALTTYAETRPTHGGEGARVPAGRRRVAREASAVHRRAPRAPTKVHPRRYGRTVHSGTATISRTTS